VPQTFLVLLKSEERQGNKDTMSLKKKDLCDYPVVEILGWGRMSEDA
jgi:hypothetical protein